MTIFTVLTQLAFAVFFFITLHCEWSRKYRDCGIPSFIRGFLMVASGIIGWKVGTLAASPIGVQIVAFVGTLVILKMIYDKVLKRQLKISNYHLKKNLLGAEYTKRTYR